MRVVDGHLSGKVKWKPANPQGNVFYYTQILKPSNSTATVIVHRYQYSTTLYVILSSIWDIVSQGSFVLLYMNFGQGSDIWYRADGYERNGTSILGQRILRVRALLTHPNGPDCSYQLGVF